MPQTQDVQAVGTETRRLLALATISAAVCFTCVAIPMFVIRPFRPQGAQELEIALAVRRAGPWLAGVCAAVVLLLLVRSWKTRKVGGRAAMAALFLVAIACAV